MNEFVQIGEDNIVYIKYKPQMSIDDVSVYIRELTEVVEASAEPVCILTDIGPTQGIISSAIRSKIAEGIKPLKKNIHKSAVVGFNSFFKKSAVSIVLTLSGRKDIKIFDDKEKALEWLKS